MEAIIVLVGFLGVGKTTLLRKLVRIYLDKGWSPNIILNDYENANLDAQQFFNLLPPDQVNALSGSCICCSGIGELREQVNSIPTRKNGITLIEANGTTDACELMGFLGVGLAPHFYPPIQISVADVRHWQKRGTNNELEASQIQVSSLIILNHIDGINQTELNIIKQKIRIINPLAVLVEWNEFTTDFLVNLFPIPDTTAKIDHKKAHWSSCSIDLPKKMRSDKLGKLLDKLPASLLRVKGCTQLDDDNGYSYFEKTPSGEIFVQPYRGEPVTGPKLVTIGPGSNPSLLQELMNKYR